ncbi:ABC-type antimicrobial peptide transport system, permease component [Mucilaginibacter xinganensis]|uniref:ABC-type antimicrobial peptide transport system, permease component n=1 Tax=Mucilaginibacter xinganensis TaxID=1234841 RepID=A0A223NRL9_9SPHI|nr:ABC-type antimicrobial peptide transport system, permease component [Mucilaginibacter xinganensis]
MAAMATLFSGFTLALLLAFAKRERQTANLFLSAALTIMVLKTGGLTPIFLPALGPLLYFYVRRMTAPNLQFNRKDVLHFCPLLVAYWMPGWLLLISVVIYLYLSHRLIQGFYSRLRPVLMDRPRFAFRRLDNTLHLLALLCLLWLFNDVFSFTVAFILIGMAAEVMLKLDSSTQLATPITDRYDAKEKSRRLMEAVAANRLYEDAELTLTSLAVKLKIHPHDLSRIINTGMEKNFSDFINEFRVRAIVGKMQDPAYDRLTLLGIAYESGFNSKTTFNRVFKEMTGKTPVEYKNSLNKEVPIDKLAPRLRILPVILRSDSPPNWAPGKLNRNYMLTNYLKIAWRNLIKNKVLSFINIGGLAVGMAVVTLISLWILDEVSFNKYHSNYHRIAQVMQNVTINGEVKTSFHVPYPLAAELRKNYGSDFKSVAMSTLPRDYILALGDKKLTEQGAFMEAGGPALFTLNMLEGRGDAIKDPSSILISAATAKAFFGNEDPMGKVLKLNLRWNGLDNLKIAGVYADLPENTTLGGMAFIGSWGHFEAGLSGMREPWGPGIVNLYVQLAHNADLDKVSLKVRDEMLRHLKPVAASAKPALFLQPMSKWHLYSEFKDGKNTGGEIQYVRLFGIVGIFVLLLACINFMNLSTARSEKRAREVGIRKAIGSSRSQLIYQFYGESVLCVLLAFLAALLLARLSLPAFNQLAGKQMNIPWNSPAFWLAGIGLSLVTAIITGSYPALYLSSFKPVKVLKGAFRVGRLASVPRKVLVVLQFTVSIILIIGTIVVIRQIIFAKDRPIGYSQDRLVAIPVRTIELHQHFDAIKQALANNGTITEMAEADAPPNKVPGTTGGIGWPGKEPNLDVNFGQEDISYDYGKTIGWEFSAGRDFSPSFLSDSAAVIINQAAADFMTMKKPTENYVTFYGQKFKIIGVTKDIINRSPYEQVQPMVYFLAKWAGGCLLLKISPKMSTSNAISNIASVLKTENPEQPFEYHFVDQEYAKEFNNEERIGKLAFVFAGLAIFISCLGLFGMASFMAEQRVKEIGIRKVLGASVFALWQLLSKDFAILVFISIIIASPVAYYFMHNWLRNYQYHTDVAWWIFIVTAIGAILITLITVSFQSIKAALANPIKSLKTE